LIKSLTFNNVRDERKRLGGLLLLSWESSLFGLRLNLLQLRLLNLLNKEALRGRSRGLRGRSRSLRRSNGWGLSHDN
jgi:hypothetical protein